MVKASEKKTGWSDRIDVKAGRHARFFIKDVICDYTLNYARSSLYTYKDKPCCFSPDDPDIKDLKASILSQGQLEPIRVWSDNLGRPHVHSGYRRFFAFCLLADDGLLDQIPNADGRITAIKVSTPKKPEDHLASAEDNLHENMKKPPTPVDIAFTLRRFALSMAEGGEFGLGKKEAGLRIAKVVGHPMSETYVGKHLLLLSLRPAVLAQVHRGDLPMARALREASKNGEGRSRGPQNRIKLPELRALADHMPKGYRELAMFIVGASEDEPEVIGQARSKLEQAQAAAAAEAKKAAPKDTKGRRTPPKKKGKRGSEARA
jgi:hypothetical protein